MSYTIEYNRVFLKSRQGYTPVVLMGDSNLYMGKRRSRSWSCWCGLLGVSREELLQKANSMMGSDEHWVKNGKWIDDKALLNWVNSGIELAVYLEPLLQINNMRAVNCKVYSYKDKISEGKIMLEKSCSTTSDLDSWIDAVYSYMDSSMDDVIPVINLRYENIRLPSRIKGAVLLKQGRNQYVKNIEFDADGHIHAVSYCSNVLHAMVFESCEQIPNLSVFGAFRPVKADVRRKPNNVALKINSGIHAGRFIGNRGNRKVSIVPESAAKRYPDLRAALKAKKEIEERFNVTCEPYILTGGQIHD